MPVQADTDPQTRVASGAPSASSQCATRPAGPLAEGRRRATVRMAIRFSVVLAVALVAAGCSSSGDRVGTHRPWLLLGSRSASTGSWRARPRTPPVRRKPALTSTVRTAHPSSGRDGSTRTGLSASRPICPGARRLGGVRKRKRRSVRHCCLQRASGRRIDSTRFAVLHVVRREEVRQYVPESSATVRSAVTTAHRLSASGPRPRS